MTDETALTAKLLFESDSGFRSFVQLWDENRRPDPQLIDYLLDRGMEPQAACVRWCVQRPDMEVWAPVYSLGERDGFCGPYPGRMEAGWRFTACPEETRDRNHEVPSERVEGSFLEGGTPIEAILALLDAWKESQ
ncbi:hypothetical protein [Gemmata massiliana]|nr:hypothetical protein [Gemmata massiliana]